MSRKIKVIDVVLSAPYQIGEYSYTNICKTVQLAIPDDGHDWHVYGESNNEVVERRMRDDLISRKSLIENLNKFAPEHYSALVNDLIAKEPTAFDKERVITEMKKNSHNFYPSIDHYCLSKKAVELKKAIEIVEKGGVK